MFHQERSPRERSVLLALTELPSVAMEKFGYQFHSLPHTLGVARLRWATIGQGGEVWIAVPLPPLLRSRSFGYAWLRLVTLGHHREVWRPVPLPPPVSSAMPAGPSQ